MPPYKMKELIPREVDDRLHSFNMGEIAKLWRGKLWKADRAQLWFALFNHQRFLCWHCGLYPNAPEVFEIMEAPSSARMPILWASAALASFPSISSSAVLIMQTDTVTMLFEFPSHQDRELNIPLSITYPGCNTMLLDTSPIKGFFCCSPSIGKHSIRIRWYSCGAL